MDGSPLPLTLLHEDVSLEAARDLMQPEVNTLVSARRQLATVLLSLHALHATATSAPSAAFVEAGVFKGGTSVLMARVLRNASSANRVLWSCDSFRGLPRAQDEDRGACIMTHNGSLARRKCGTGRLGWYASTTAPLAKALQRERLSEFVRIVPGWFHQTLPPTGLSEIAFLRMDGDSYNGTFESLSRLYPLVVQNGAVYIDDVGSYKGAHVALHKYFGASPNFEIHQIQEKEGYYEAVWWLKVTEF
jgi:hypothetical protein